MKVHSQYTKGENDGKLILSINANLESIPEQQLSLS